MTNVSKHASKVGLRKKLFAIGISELRKAGWVVDRIPKINKSSVRRISKPGQTMKVAIRTTQDTWIAFPRTDDDKAWVTLSDVDAVVAVSVDDGEKPKFAKVHMLDGDEMRERFDRAYAARKEAKHTIPIGRGVWLSLYKDEGTNPIQLVGAGAGNQTEPLAIVPLDDVDRMLDEGVQPTVSEPPLTIAEAKRRLAATFGVDPSSIKITVEA